MAFFKFRKAADETAATRQQPESIEAMRKRAKHRLIGAGVLVLVGVIGFPLLFDTQPRPIAVDIPIEIPDRNKAKPPSTPVAPQVTSTSGPANSAAAPVKEAPPPAQEKVAVAPPAAAPAAPAPVASTPAPKAEPAPPPKAEARPEAKAASKPAGRPAETKPAPKADDGAKAQALLEGKEPEARAATGRFIVQVGAFADADKARETRQKVEKAGLKTYTHVAETPDGKRTRVRVGPFPTRVEAERAADKIKGLDLPAAILTL